MTFCVNFDVTLCRINCSVLFCKNVAEYSDILLLSSFIDVYVIYSIFDFVLFFYFFTGTYILKYLANANFHSFCKLHAINT